MDSNETGLGEIECCPHCAGLLAEALQAAGMACEARGAIQAEPEPGDD